MKLKVFLLNLLLLFISSCYLVKSEYYENKDITKEISLSGKWDFLDNQYKPDNYYLQNLRYDWKKILVPSNWYLQGYDFSGKGIYHKTFTINPKFKNKLIRLNFDSVDYITSVWINGKYLGLHEGYFKDFNFDISNYLNFYGENELIVIVDSPFEVPNQNWSLKKRLIKGIFNHHDTRAGGAWDNVRGQDKNTGGIIGDVNLKISDKLYIEKTKLTPKVDFENNKAFLDIEIDVNSNFNLNNTSLFINLKPENFVSEEYSGNKLIKNFNIKKGSNKIVFTIENKNPHLWWSWDKGEPNLYSFSLDIVNNHTLLDSKSENIGFKEFKLNPKDNLFYLNNQKIFLKGTNYISTQWLSEMSKEKYDKDLSLMKEANINSIRVHAHIESKEFYNLCDKYGMMVWQDFPLQWGYSDDLDFHKEASKQIEEMIELLYNNTSIITWSIHNEPPWDAYWMKYKYKDYNSEQNKDLDDKLFQIAKEKDSYHYITKYSSTSEHPWYGWYSGSWKDYLKRSKQTLITEFGAQALPNLESLKKIFNEDELFPDNAKKWDKWSYHNFQRHESFDLAKIKQGNNIDEFIYNTQKYQSNLIKYAIESYRRQKYEPISGIFQFMFVEDWPSVNWGIIDYWREKKEGYYALKESYQEILPSIEFNEIDFKNGSDFKANIWIINDSNKSFENAKLNISIKTKDKILQEKTLNVNINGDSSSNVISISEKNLDNGEYDVYAQIVDNKNNVLGSNVFIFNVHP